MGQGSLISGPHRVLRMWCSTFLSFFPLLVGAEFTPSQWEQKLWIMRECKTLTTQGKLSIIVFWAL